MRRLLLAATCLFLVAAGPRHRRPPPPPPPPVGPVAAADIVVHGPAGPAAEIIAAERAFASRSMEAGGQLAFSEFLDPQDSRAFMGGPPIEGAQAIGAAHAGPGKLNWWPKEVFVSRSGDMGTAWGRYRFVTGDGEAALGTYVTIWRKSAKGAWKAIIDIGAPDRGPPATD